MTANTASRQAALERFVAYNSKLPTCMRHPTIDEDLIRILGGKWKDLPRQEGESEVMDRGMGYLCQGKRLSKLLTAFEKVTEFQSLIEDSHTKTWLGYATFWGDALGLRMRMTKGLAVRLSLIHI